MKNNLLYTSLLNAGLDPLSAKIYLDLLENENLTISDLAKKYSVQRNKIYDCLSQLEEMDLVSKPVRFSRQIEVKSPTKIIGILQQKEYQLKNNLDNLSTVLPSIMKQYYDKKADFIKVFKGKTQMLYLMDLILAQNNTKEILGFGDFQTNMEFWGLNYELDWRERRVKKGIFLRGLTFRDAITLEIFPKNEVELRDMKYLPNKFRSEGLFIVSGNTVTQWNPVLPRAIYIEDVVFTSFFRNMFEIIWELV